MVGAEFAVPVGILEQSLREYSVDSSTAFDLERAQKLAQVCDCLSRCFREREQTPLSVCVFVRERVNDPQEISIAAGCG